MSITLELSEELVARLAREAQARGMGIEAYVQWLISATKGPETPPARLATVRAIL